jgi:hypothetical protein
MAQSVRWFYSEHEDEMGRGTNKFADLESLNTVSFGFPYEGEQHAVLHLQRNAKHGLEVWLAVSRGQFTPPGYGQSLSVKFDDGAIQQFPFSVNMDTTNYIWIGEARRFLGQLRRAKKLKIEAIFWGQGDRVLEFDVHGLRRDW